MARIKKATVKTVEEDIAQDVQSTQSELEIPSSVEIEVEQVECEDDNIEIVGKNQQYSLTMYIDKNIDKKTFIRFIKKVERLVRGNQDFKDYFDFLVDEKGLHKCVVFSRVEAGSAEIQLHHCISTLYDICCTVTNKLINTGKKVSGFIVADEVIKLHFQNKIALIPVTTTVHQLIHSTGILIPKHLIYGNYMEYYEEYKDAMDAKEISLYTEDFQQLTQNDLFALVYKQPEKDTHDKT